LTAAEDRDATHLRDTEHKSRYKY